MPGARRARPRFLVPALPLRTPQRRAFPTPRPTRWPDPPRGGHPLLLLLLRDGRGRHHRPTLTDALSNIAAPVRRQGIVMPIRNAIIHLIDKKPDGNPAVLHLAS